MLALHQDIHTQFFLPSPGSEGYPGDKQCGSQTHICGFGLSGKIRAGGERSCTSAKIKIRSCRDLLENKKLRLSIPLEWFFYLVQNDIVLLMGVADKPPQMLLLSSNICDFNQVNANFSLVREQNSWPWVEDLVNCVLN